MRDCKTITKEGRKQNDAWAQGGLERVAHLVNDHTPGSNAGEANVRGVRRDFN